MAISSNRIYIIRYLLIFAPLAFGSPSHFLIARVATAFTIVLSIRMTTHVVMTILNVEIIGYVFKITFYEVQPNVRREVLRFKREYSVIFPLFFGLFRFSILIFTNAIFIEQIPLIIFLSIFAKLLSRNSLLLWNLFVDRIQSLLALKTQSFASFSLYV